MMALEVCRPVFMTMYNFRGFRMEANRKSAHSLSKLIQFKLNLTYFFFLEPHKDIQTRSSDSNLVAVCFSIN